MNGTPKALKISIGFFGRTNVGKSSIINLITNQGVSIVSEIPGTTTDMVSKSMELPPVGPVNLIDTPGLDDGSQLGEQRLKVSRQVISTVDLIILITDCFRWTQYEEWVLSESKKYRTPVIIINNKTDLKPDVCDCKKTGRTTENQLNISCKELKDNESKRNSFINSLSGLISGIVHHEEKENLIFSYLIPGENKNVILVMPVDSEAPKGRLILPQVQTIREALDNNISAICVTPETFTRTLDSLSNPPALVITDSQAVKEIAEKTPDSITLTTFSILFSRLKGELKTLAAGAAELYYLKDNDKVLISEACTHHSTDEDIGRVKIPNLLRKFTGKNLKIEFAQGKDFYNVQQDDYRLIIHCGGCMITRKEFNSRLNYCTENNLNITNYGMAISVFQNVLERTIKLFPEALAEFKNRKENPGKNEY